MGDDRQNEMMIDGLDRVGECLLSSMKAGMISCEIHALVNHPNPTVGPWDRAPSDRGNFGGIRPLPGPDFCALIETQCGCSTSPRARRP